jgi:Uma2 family endonuclease
MADPAPRRATYADLEAVSPHLVAEIIHGALVTHPRPSPRHGVASNSLAAELTGPFQKGRGGPGGWIFMDEPELHFGDDVVVPDIAGWRRERLQTLPDTAYLTVAPDWVCEIISPSTAIYDRGPKREIYARVGVSHLWHVDPVSQTLEAFQLTAGRWLLVATRVGGEEVALPPFEAVPFPLAVLWPFDEPIDPNAPPTSA